MNKRALAILAAVVLLAVAGGVGSFAWSFLKPTAEASGPIRAIEVETTERAPEEAAPRGVAQVEEAESGRSEPPPTSDAPIVVDDAPTAVGDAPTPTEGVSAPAEPEVATNTPVSSSPADRSVTVAAAPVQARLSTRVFETVAGRTEARFLIDEVLRGEATTVVGTTDQVAAQFVVTGQDLAGVKIGPVLVNARTLATPNEFRNRAIRNKILHTDDHEFVRFTPTATAGLPDVGVVGETFTFDVTGDLAVAGTTRSVTFRGEGRFVTPSRVEAKLTTTIAHADFGLTIPSPPIVASVADDVRLELTLLADELSDRVAH